MADEGVRHFEIADGEITVVQLPSSEKKKRAFLRQLQGALGASGTIGALAPGHARDVYIVPHALEAVLREALALSGDDEWDQQLRNWGALTVNRLTRDAFFHLFQRGIAVVDGEVLGTAKLALPVAPVAAAPAATQAPGALLPKAFDGPYDWNLDARGANVVAAWQMFAGEPRFRDALPWQDIRIGHVDTGYTEHEALGWSAGNSTTVRPAEGHDYWDNPSDPLRWDDPHDDWLVGSPGHGTRISAAIAGFAVRPPARPFYGVAPGVAVLPYRVTDSVIVDHKKKEIGQAIRRAVDAGCHVVNISLGAMLGSSHLSSALDHAYERGVIVVCAAGQHWGEVIYPGRYNRCVTMGGVGPGLKPWRAAARGQYVDLCGPADTIRRVLAEDLPRGTAAQRIHSEDGDGTSYATATCSGIAALWLAWHGVDHLRAVYGNEGWWQIPAAFKKLARATATAGNWPSSEDGNYGSGVINAAALLAALLPPAGSLHKANPAAGLFDPND
jgi:lambda repressor-like predicted transcriptional regulator